MKLYGHPESGHAFKVKFFLEHAGLEHDYELVDIGLPRERRSAEFQRHARFGEVPALVHDGRSIVQSNAILLHLASHTGAWGAEDDGRFDRVHEWLFWEANRIGMCLPQLRVFRRFEDHGIDEGTRAWLAARCDLDLSIMEGELADGRSWIVPGDAPTVADFSLCGYLVHAAEAEVSPPEGVREWLARLAALPGWRTPYEMLG